MKTSIQTTEIRIAVPPRDEGAPPVPVVTATRTTFLLDDDGKVIGKLDGSDDTRVLANVTQMQSFAPVHAALASAIDAAFAPPPAPEPEPEPEPSPSADNPGESNEPDMAP
jgi:hypothetical protein